MYISYKLKNILSICSLYSKVYTEYWKEQPYKAQPSVQTLLRLKVFIEFRLTNFMYARDYLNRDVY